MGGKWNLSGFQHNWKQFSLCEREVFLAMTSHLLNLKSIKSNCKWLLTKKTNSFELRPLSLKILFLVFSIGYNVRSRSEQDDLSPHLCLGSVTWFNCALLIDLITKKRLLTLRNYKR